MNEDVRDPRVADLLEAAVRRIEPSRDARLGSVLRRGGQRRAARWTAIGMALAVFIGAVAWGSLTVGNRRALPLNVASWNTYRDPQGWWARYPDSWHLQPFVSQVGHVTLQGAFFSSVLYDFRHPDLGSNEETSMWDMSGFPGDAVVVDFEAFSGGPFGLVQPNSTFPLSLDQARVNSAGSRPKQGTALYLPVIWGEQSYKLWIWLGPRVSKQNLEIARSIVHSITFGPDTSHWATAGSLDSTGWTFTYPPDWRIQQLPACPNAPGRTGAIVTNTDFEFRNPGGGTPGCEDRFVLEGFPSDGVAMALIPVGIRIGIFVPTSDTPFPISWDQLQRTGGIEGGPDASYLGVTVGGDQIMFVRTWIGPDAPADAADQLKAVVGSLEAAGSAHWATYSDSVNGFSVTYPNDWERTSQSLTPELSDPHEILSLGTYPLRPGGKACIDAYLPGNALADLGTDDVLITLQEGSAQGMPPRPAAFGPDAARIAFDGFPACDGYAAVPLRGWWIAFADQGRGFYAFVALGPGVARDGQIERVVWHVLDSLRFDQA